MESRDLRDAIIILQTQYELLERQVRDNGITAKDVREKQAVILNEINNLKAMADGSSSGFTGFLERMAELMLNAKRGTILFLTGCFIIGILLVFKAESIAAAIVQVLNASAP